MLQSTGHALPLWHVQFGPLAARETSRWGQVVGEPVEGGVHMFCSPERDPLPQELLAQGVEPSSTASIIAHRMRASDWTWILTSDISPEPVHHPRAIIGARLDQLDRASPCLPIRGT